MLLGKRGSFDTLGIGKENGLQRYTVVMLVRLVVFVATLIWAGMTLAADVPPTEGGVLPEMVFPVPTQSEEQQYLGIPGQGTFKLPKLQAKAVIIEIFSMYCPFCQKEAPKVNELYHAIEQNEDFRGKVKLVGIGVGNSAFEVNTFRNAYGVPFPLFADPDFAVHNLLGKVRTPYFIVIKINTDGSHKVVYSKVGSPGEPREFLNMIGKQAGIQKGS